MTLATLLWHGAMEIRPMDRFRSYLYKGTMALLTLTITIRCYVVPVSSLAPTAQIQAAGSVYYVAPTGNDSNPGTQNQPWRTIQKAANTMVAGDSTTIRAGNYAERVQVTRSGAPGAPIAYRADGTVTMKGFTVKADYIAISGFDISDTDDDWEDGWGIFVEGSFCDIERNYVHFATRGGIIVWANPGDGSKTSHCIVKNNRLYRNAVAGITVYGRDHLVEGNEIWGTIQYHPKRIDPPSTVDADGMRFFGTGHTIRKNYIHDISFNDPENVDPHIDCFQTWGPAYDIVFEQNRCEGLSVNKDGHGVQGFQIEEITAPVRNLIIRDNIMRVFRMVNANNCEGMTIANNTFVSDLSFNRSSPLGIYLSRSPNATIKNNIFYDVGSGIGPYLGLDQASRSGLDVGYNCVYMSDGRNPAGSPWPHDLWKVNPLFVNPASGDFHLQPNSPAIDAGVAVTIVTDDYDGNPRPQGAGYDIGAYELPAFRKTALPTDAHSDEIITFTISTIGNGNPVTVTDVLPAQLAYVSSSTTCPGTLTYDGNARQATYTGTPPAGLDCVIQIPTRVNTDERMAITNSATIEIGQSQLSVSGTVILNGLALYLPIILKSG